MELLPIWPERMVELTGYDMNLINEPLAALTRLVYTYSYPTLISWVAVATPYCNDGISLLRSGTLLRSGSVA